MFWLKLEIYLHSVEGEIGLFIRETKRRRSGLKVVRVFTNPKKN